MFDVGFTELALLFVIGLLILGPERLPRVASQLGRWVGRARRTANQLRHQLEREVALEEMSRSQRQQPRERETPYESGGTPASETESGAADDTASAAGEAEGEHVGPPGDAETARAGAPEGSATPAGTATSDESATSDDDARTGNPSSP